MDISSLAAQVCRIAEKAGEAILDIYQDQNTSWEVEAKADDSPLTLADRRANALICEALAALDQKYPIISEENKEVPYEQRKDYDRFWLVDPLDGTKEFIKRNGEFTVNIALVEGRQPVLGVVFAPVSNELYVAERGKGAWLKSGAGETPLKAASFRRTDRGLQVVASRSHLNEETQAFISGLADPRKVSRGSSLKFLLLARGEAHIYPRLAPTMEWDTGAAQIVLEEAGGKVVEADGNQPLHYNKPVLRNPHFIAYGHIQD